MIRDRNFIYSSINEAYFNLATTLRRYGILDSQFCEGTDY